MIKQRSFYFHAKGILLLIAYKNSAKNERWIASCKQSSRNYIKYAFLRKHLRKNFTISPFIYDFINYIPFYITKTDPDWVTRYFSREMHHETILKYHASDRPRHSFSPQIPYFTTLPTRLHLHQHPKTNHNPHHISFIINQPADGTKKASRQAPEIYPHRINERTKPGTTRVLKRRKPEKYPRHTRRDRE